MLEQPAELDEIHLIQPPEHCMRQAPMRQNKPGKDCRVCFGEHDDEIHAATVSVRAWHRSQVIRGLGRLAAIPIPPIEESSEMVQVL